MDPYLDRELEIIEVTHSTNRIETGEQAHLTRDKKMNPCHEALIVKFDNNLTLEQATLLESIISRMSGVMAVEPYVNSWEPSLAQEAARVELAEELIALLQAKRKCYVR